MRHSPLNNLIFGINVCLFSALATVDWELKDTGDLVIGDSDGCLRLFVRIDWQSVELRGAGYVKIDVGASKALKRK